MSGLALQAASKTNDTAGDGTTTATILSAAIIAEGMKIVAAGTNPIQVSRALSACWLYVSTSLLQQASIECKDVYGLGFDCALILLLLGCGSQMRCYHHPAVSHHPCHLMRCAVHQAKHTCFALADMMC